mmetsp:Transcript_169/g.366  ORF Transcript_169/g.366 Transcript_169/m.366 type:complete len:129 (+) Transcript_169:324-710(+)
MAILWCGDVATLRRFAPSTGEATRHFARDDSTTLHQRRHRTTTLRQKGHRTATLHQRWQRVSGFMTEPTGHWNVSAKEGNWESVPMTRYLAGGCWSVSRAERAPTLFSFSHHVCPMAMKKSLRLSASG